MPACCIAIIYVCIRRPGQLQHGLIDRCRPFGKPYICQIIRTEAAYRRPQDSQHRYVLQRIIDDLEQRQHRFDLDSPEISEPGVSISRYTHKSQLVDENIRPVHGGPHEYDDISVFDWPVYVPLFVVHIEAARFMCDKTPDYISDQAGFILDTVKRFLSTFFGPAVFCCPAAAVSAAIHTMPVIVAIFTRITVTVRAIDSRCQTCCSMSLPIRLRGPVRLPIRLRGPVRRLIRLSVLVRRLTWSRSSVKCLIRFSGPVRLYLICYR